jgi:hypothetical protein
MVEVGWGAGRGIGGGFGEVWDLLSRMLSTAVVRGAWVVVK